MPSSSANASSEPVSPPAGAAPGPPGAPRTLGKYELLRPLGRGGMGEVHLARLPGELGFEKKLVVKTIRADLAADPRFVELFAAEAKTAVGLSHPNITPIYELGRADDGTLYTAMGWVDGPSLHAIGEQLRATAATLELGAALFIVRELLDGLAHAHSRELGRPPVVHRDITPRNVLVDRSGRVQIVDFGIAKPAEAEVAGITGSAGYMAPEQARGGVVDPRADVFSVGCVLYELLTNRRAFPGEGVWMAPSMAGLPGPLATVLERALELDAGRRYADAGEFHRVIAGLQAELTPGFATQDLARIVRELFPAGVPTPPAGGPLSSTPATRLGVERSQTFATRLTPVPSPASPGPAEPGGTPLTPATADQAPKADADRLGPAPSQPAPARPDPAQPRRRLTPLLYLLAGAGVAAGLTYLAIAGGRSEGRRAPAPAAKAATSDARTPPQATADPDGTPPEPVPTPVNLEVVPATAEVHIGADPLPGPPYQLPEPDPAAPEAAVLELRHADHRPRSLPLHQALADGRAAGGTLRLTLEALELGRLTVLAPEVAWATVSVDGTELGTTPLKDHELLEGRRRVVVRCSAEVCGEARVLYDRHLHIRPGRGRELVVRD